MNKQPHQVAQTKQNLLTALCRLGKEKPLSKLSVTAICQTAGYNRTTFYHYYQDVEDMVDQLAAQEFGRIRANLAENIRHHQPSAAFVTTFARLHAEDAAYYDFLFSPSGFPAFSRIARQELAGLLGQKLGLPSNDPRTAYRLDYLITASLTVVGHWIANQRDLPSTVIADLLGELTRPLQKN